MKSLKVLAGLALLAMVVLLSARCNEGTREKPVSQEASASTASAPASSAAPAAAAETGAAAPAASGSSPLPAASAAAPTAPPMESVTGKIVETMDSGGYTYMKLSTNRGEVWAAVNQTKVKKGETVSVANPMEMNGFESKTLKRKFDRILFGTLAEGGAASTGGAAPPIDAAAAQGQMPPGHPDASDPRFKQMMAAQHAAAAAGPADAGDVKVPKADGTNAKTVAEIVDGRTGLKDKDVVVRGKVVKFLPGIMGKNWLHVRDGSGTPEKKNNDLTVTTSDMAAVGDVVVVKGPVHLDRDFGAGYAYAVMIEDAKLSK